MSDRQRNHLDDPFPGRKVLARWVVRGTLTLDSAMHLGGEESEMVDMAILRDPREAEPLLPGTTLAGALRNALSDRLNGYGGNEPKEVAALFGAGREEVDGSQSPLIVFDALGSLGDSHGIEIRDGVALSPTTGTADDHKKYDYEVLPAGSSFPIRLDLLVSKDDDEKSLLEALVTALDAFSHGDNSFGAKRSRGLGRVSATWAAKRFDLTTAKGWTLWALSDHKQPIAASPAHSSIRDVIDAAAPDGFRPLSMLDDARKRVVIDLAWRVEHDLLVRSPGTEPGAPDVSHLTSGGAPILPGTSLAGALRTQALRIAKLVRDGKSDAERWVDRLFGRRFEGQRPPPWLKPRASRLQVGEASLEGSRQNRQTRIAIDRFTQGVVPPALFGEQPEIGGRGAVRLELRDPKEGELGLVALALKDLLGARLPVGGTASIGRGTLTGSATVTFYDDAARSPRVARLETESPPSGEAACEIADSIRQFHNAPPLSDDEGTHPPTGGSGDLA